jgi:regulator of sirC expression with transglutaminase-like and TPR domain
VALGVLYIAVARSCGWSMAGVNFPSHFLIRLDAHGERVLLDPFAARSLNGREELRRLLHKIAGPDTALTEQHEAAANDRTVLLRLANNIKLRLLGEHRAEAALEVLEHMLLFAPNVAALWHEAGIVEAHLGHIKAATRRLHAFQVRATDDKARAHAERLLSELRNKLN